MHPDLVKLLDVKVKDESLAAADAAVAEVVAAAAALDARLDRVRRERDKLQAALADHARRRDELFHRVEAHRTQQDKRQQRLAQVKNVKEATAVTAEIDLGRQVLAREEGDWMAQAEEVTRLEGQLAAAANAVAEAEAGQAGEREQLATRRDDADGVRTTAWAAREASAAQLEKPLRTRYERLRSSRSGNAVIALSGFACSACFTLVPVSRRGQIKGGLLIEGCEVCGVILYQPERPDPVPASGEQDG